jgi:AbrB family looped-hinge helix DNA binding protein
MPGRRQPHPEGEGPETSSVYERGQTVVPKKVRDTLGIAYGTQLRWQVKEGVIQVVPIPKEPAQALRGTLKGTGFTFKQFMAERQAERRRERRLEERDAKRWPTSSTRRR